MGGGKRKVGIGLEIIIIIIIIINRHELGLNRLVVALSNSLFQGLPSSLGPFFV